ncbi:hypothetical protein LMG18091_03790 [Ralstonia wenshanensis]|uniref:Uncharacterized protein n=1 Tax=Ralstonia wenshanensis TaxID=2842456 RepID=A0AAD2ESL5_9RALS|nr:hypothetical protein LMG18091_03790 [Ralstonia wenshanensis]
MQRYVLCMRFDLLRQRGALVAPGCSKDSLDISRLCCAYVHFDDVGQLEHAGWDRVNIDHVVQSKFETEVVQGLALIDCRVIELDCLKQLQRKTVGGQYCQHIQVETLHANIDIADHIAQHTINAEFADCVENHIGRRSRPICKVRTEARVASAKKQLVCNQAPFAVNYWLPAYKNLTLTPFHWWQHLHPLPAGA